MTSAELRDSIKKCGAPPRYIAFTEAVEARIARKRGAPEIRKRVYHELSRYLTNVYPTGRLEICLTPAQSHDIRHRAWEKKQILDLAEKAGQNFDEHGYSGRRGIYRETAALDFVPPWRAQAAPYCDLGGEGLALVAVTRTTVYPPSSRWRPSSATSKFLVGRNEAGTYFAHPVSPRCNSVESALDWIWGGKAADIIQRQGDIALISGNGGPRMPSSLPRGHVVDEAAGVIRHATHPDLPLPGKGQRIIVGRRAAERASAATRD